MAACLCLAASMPLVALPADDGCLCAERELAPVPAELLACCSLSAAALWPFNSRSRTVLRRPLLETPKATHTALVSCSESESARYSGVARRERAITCRITCALRRSADKSRSSASRLRQPRLKTASIAFFNSACFMRQSNPQVPRNRFSASWSNEPYGTRWQ